MARTGFSILILLLISCGGSPPAPVEDRQYGGASSAATGDYRVQKGDTLYSIAFRYGLDYRRLGAANRIAAPYTIFPGQRLTLKEEALPRAASSSATYPTRAPSKPAAAPGAAASTPAAKPAKKPTAVSNKPSPVPAKPVTGGAVKSWRWPSSGKVVRKYSGTVHKGIDIGGQRGDPVQSVAAGQVVYAGTGIVGLGELVIVKHNEIYLSAYGHNDRLLVGEGDVVKVGQKIAEKGSSGTDSVRLHFEIRKEGKPIDPLRLLPRR